MTDALDAPGHTWHVLSELDLDVRVDGDELRCEAGVVPEMYVPGTDCLRASVLASWTDVATGLLCIDVFDGRIPMTLDLAVDLARPARDCPRVCATARVVKVGRSVAVTEIEFGSADRDGLLAYATATFAAAPDPALNMPSKTDRVSLVARNRGRLRMPLAERVGCERPSPGVATMPRREDGLNAANTINGGLITLVIEEAALSSAPDTTLSSLAVRYLRPARIGPVIGTATRHGETARVAVRDNGADDRLVAIATTRTFPEALR